MGEGILDAEACRQKAVTLFQHNPNYLNAFLLIVDACDGEAVALSELEARVAEVPSYEKLKQPPFFPVHWLFEVGCLEELYLDEEGQLINQKAIAQLTEDEFDDLVFEFAYRTTELGRTVRKEFSPKTRLAVLFGDEPDRVAVYEDLLRFLYEKKSFAQIEALLRNRPELATTSRDGVKLQPSLFVDKLSATGAIAYHEGWQITEEGKEMVEG